jgi:hypothetical protein
MPASEPAGVPRSTRMTSPDVSIEPLVLVVAQRLGELGTHPVLSEQPDGCRDGLRDSGSALVGKPLQRVMCRSVYANGRGVSHIQKQSL